MTSKNVEALFGSTRTPAQKPSQDRYRRDSARRNGRSAALYTHPSYVPQLREMIQAKLLEFRQARSTALDAIDQRIHELSSIKHEMDPAVVTELMVTLAEARSILLSLNPTAQGSEKALTETSEKLRMLVKQRQSTAS